MQYPQDQHVLFVHHPIVNRMATAVAAADVCFHKAEIPPHLWVVREPGKVVFQRVVILFRLRLVKRLKRVNVDVFNVLLSVLGQVSS